MEVELNDEIKQALYKIDMVFSTERETLLRRYEVEKKCIWETDTEQAKELFADKYPTVERYIDVNKRVRTINDAHLVLDIASKI